MVLTGGSGILGTELIKCFNNSGLKFFAPTSLECDIRSSISVDLFLRKVSAGTLIHSAASTNVKQIEDDPTMAYDVNVLGTINIINACKKYNMRLVFISTDYVFDGTTGDYVPDDPINPLSKYAKTKAAAELLVRTYEKSLVIRTSFFGYDFPYPAAFHDQWSTKDYIDIMAPKIFDEIQKNEYGITHVYSKKRTIYEIAKTRSPHVKSMSYKDFNFSLPKDTSLRSDK